MSDTIFNALEDDLLCERKQTILPRFPQVTFHNHDGYEIYLFLGGDANFYVESNGKILERGDVILTVPYTFHSADARPDRPYDRIIINMKESFLSRFQDESCNLADCFYRFNADQMNLIRLNEQEIDHFVNLALALEETKKRDIYGKSLLIQALLTELLVFLNQKMPEADVITSLTGTMPSIVKTAIEYINAHFTEDIHLKDLEILLHHNKDHICRCFKQITGISVGQFILEKRLSLSKNLLAKGVYPSDASYLSGFHDYANFSRTFSKHVGQSPKQYQLSRGRGL